MSEQHLERVAVISRSIFRHFLPALARHLRERNGSEIHLYCVTPEQKREYEVIGAGGLFKSVNAVDYIWPDTWSNDLSEDEVFARGRANEQRYGVTINSLAVGNRVLGRGYALGGFHYARSPQSEGIRYVHVVHAFNEHIAFWEKEIPSKRITMLMQPGRIEAVVARAHGIPVRNMEPARLGPRYLWAVDEFQYCPDIKEAYDRILDVDDAPTIERPTLGHLNARQRALSMGSWLGMARNMSYATAQKAYWIARGYKKAKTFSLRQSFAYRLRQKRDLAQVTAPDLPTLDEVARRPFVFFTLHTEPERSLQGLSPEYFYQLSCIASISRDLPAGFRLAVKEHSISVGQRPTDFYRQIREFKNVALIDVRNYGIDVVKRCAGVVTITGSIGVEAASMGKPVVVFGRHTSYSFLPHVRVVTDEAQLAGYLNELLCLEYDAPRAARDGKRLLKALEQVSFDMDRRIDSNPRAFDDSILENAYRGLIASLRHGVFLEDPVTGVRATTHAETRVAQMAGTHR